MKKLFLIAFLSIALVSSGCVQEQDPTEPEAGAPAIDRQAYGTGIFLDSQGNPVEKPIEEAFVNLPPVPGDFWSKKKAFETGGFSAAESIGEDYFLQPEFLPEFEEIGLSYWKQPDLERWGAYGFGVYPAEQAISLKRGEQTTVFAFVHSAYYIQSFQGLKLVPVDSNSLLEDFEIGVLPKNILLGPSWPVFDRMWMHDAAIRIRVRENALPGVYKISFDAENPDKEAEEKWVEKLAGKKYFSGTAQVSISRPRLVVFVQVERS